MRKTQNSTEESQNPQESRNSRASDFAQLKEMSATKLTQIAREMDVPGAAGRLRLLARAGAQLFAQLGRRLRRPDADSQVRTAHRRHGLGPDSSARRRREVFLAGQGRSHQL